MQKMKFTSYSETDWSISTPSLMKLVKDYKNFKENAFSFLDIKT